MRIFQNFRAAMAWMRAYSAASRGRHEESLRLLRSVSGPHVEASQWRLLEVHNLAKLDRTPEALKAAVSLINDLSSHATLDVNQIYFLQHAKLRAGAAFAKLFPQTPVPEKFIVPSLITSGVDARWLRTFPRPPH